MQTKKELKYFSIMDYEKEQEYLREQHKAGWRFVTVTGIGMYHFEKCEPMDVVYQLDYNQEGLKNKEEYIQMFKDCGWTYLQDYVGYSYFSKPASEMKKEERIFCDDSSRLAMMERVFKGRLLPLVVILSCVLVPQFINNLLNFHNYVLAVILGACIIAYLVIFATFGIKYTKYKENLTK